MSLRLFIILLLFVNTLCACKPAEKEGAASAPNALLQDTDSDDKTLPLKPGRQVALVLKTMANPFFLEMEKGARRAEKELGLKLVVRSAAAETAIEQQIQIIDELIAQKVGAIVIAPGDSQRLIPVLRKAQAAGIKLVNVDNPLHLDTMASARMEVPPLVSVDNEQAAFAAMQFLLQKAKPPVKLAILEGIRSAENAKQRLHGAQRALSLSSHVTVVASESANWKIDEAYQQTALLYQKYPDINAFFCANDMMALGTLRYLQERGKSGVLIASYDALDDVKTAIKEGEILVSVDQQAAQQGYQAVQLAARMLKGEAVAPKTMIEARLVSASQLR